MTQQELIDITFKKDIRCRNRQEFTDIIVICNNLEIPQNKELFDEFEDKWKRIYMQIETTTWGRDEYLSLDITNARYYRDAIEASFIIDKYYD